ncbi:MAG: DUF4236 domain-containing protein, partial [Candidatus Eremiobacteraeota bacterium]|nr:DUF4236 domain-containing protein [Candidatus Eremiobacteraeota bacterium]
MPWWIRRTLRRGPLRLTLSKGGLGASVGFGGLRVGSGPRGTYVSASKGGVYYRQYLRGAPQPGRVQSQPTHSAPAADLEFVSDAHASDDSSIAALN